MASVLDVACFFIEASNSKDEGNITNLKLNKLLYFAQACNLVVTGAPLFNDPIEKWPLGPVVNAVYQEYKEYGSNPLPVPDNKQYVNRLSVDEQELLVNVMLQYGKYSASTLVDLTHIKGSPWDVTASSSEISIDKIKAYFSIKNRIRCTDPVKYQNIKTITPSRRRDGAILLSREDYDAWD